MLDILDLKLELTKEAYRRQLDKLQKELTVLQQAVRRAGIPVVTVLEGVDASGKGDSIGHLVYPLDPRGFKVHSTLSATDEDVQRPFLTRFWTRLPRRGDFVFFDRSWNRRLLEDRLEGGVKEAAVSGVATEIRDFERQLTDEGHVVIKLWLHISAKEQKKRLAEIEADPYQKWRISQKDWKRRAGYKDYVGAAEELFELTSTANAPWTLVEANDPRYRRIKVMATVAEALRSALAAQGEANGSPAKATPAPRSKGKAAAPLRRNGLRVKSRGVRTILDRVDLTRRLTRKEYEKRLDPLQQRLRELGLECYRRCLPVVIVYEGWDASGKGGNIKRLTQELDPRGYEVIPIAAPDATEKEHHYLWRFWRQLPRAGRMGIFDRSWYGRVLVERVEGFATEPEWRRAYQEVNDFERQIVDFGGAIVKFWLHISPEEQLRRFASREKTPHKQYKIGEEDWRNRAKLNEYREAVVEMIERTSTTYAPWTIVEAEDKLWARIRTLTEVVKAIEKRVKR
jgi:polyphosphate:AMP phosphotransferase